MLKDLFDKGKCALGFHTGQWRYPLEHQCQQVQICTRCKAENRQVVHPWQTWDFANPNSCEMARRCSRCNDRESKTEHAWGTPVYQADGLCTMIRPCSRCAEKTPAGTAHVWNSWSYQDNDSCSQVATCSRCGEIGTGKRVAHDWSAWSDSKFYGGHVRVCQRCAEMIFSLGAAQEQPVSLQMAARAVGYVTDSQDSATVRQRITEQSSVLFSPVAAKYFDFAVDQLARDDSTRNTLHQLAALIRRCSDEGIDAVFAPAEKTSASSAAAASPATPDLHAEATGDAQDTRLLGHWRSTEAMSSGGFSLVTDTHCILDGNRRFQWWSKSMSGAGGSTSATEPGSWSVRDKTLVLKFDNGSRFDFEYVIEGATLLFPRERRYRLWQRVN